ncbi:MAG TPA: TRAP transporter small permease subunit [Bacteroidota bacterium]|nr:TRAP transporter small permease subunit [Bacteroidota bacterium]
MKTLQRIDAFLTRIEGWLLVFILSVMVVLSFLQVVLRNAFSESLLWGDILLRHLVLWIGFIGAALATSKDRHITIDALTRFLTPKLKNAAKIVTNLFAATVCYFLLRASVTFVENELLDQSTVYGDISSIYSQIIIPVGFGLIILHFLIRIASGIRSLFFEDPA